jgi:hypothetical protein
MAWSRPHYNPAVVAELPTGIGRYEIVSRLGQGGMGSLYLAKDPKIGRGEKLAERIQAVLRLSTDRQGHRRSRGDRGPRLGFGGRAGGDDRQGQWHPVESPQPRQTEYRLEKIAGKWMLLPPR